VVTAVLAAACASGCSSSHAASLPPTRVELTTIGSGGIWGQVGQDLAGAYSRRLPHVVAETTRSRGLEETADAIEQGHADLAIDDAETAYIAYSKGTKADPQPHGNIRAISVLFSTAVQIVARGDAGITRISDLRGKRVDVGQRGTPVERAARLILQSHGLAYDAITPVFGGRNSVDGLRTKQLDARFFYTPYPQQSIGDLARTAGVRLIPIGRDSLEAIQQQHHFLKSVVIPSGTYPNQNEPILTVGMDVLLLCRQGLSENLVYDLTATLFDSVPELKAAHPAASAIDPDRGPATAVPLHPGAVHYYREREILR
jgi:hypothetical protein